MSSFRIASLFASLSLLCCTRADAAPWTLQSVILPPAEAGYVDDHNLGFGRTVEMNGDWLAISAMFGECVSPAGVLGGGTVLMYKRDATTGEYVFEQQICGHGPGRSIAMWDDWMLLGHPHQDDTPGDGMQHGRVSFHRLDPHTETWNFVQTFAGGVDSLMGNSVAMEGGVAAAGESGYADDRGRVRTFRLNTSGTQWISEGWVLPTPGPLGTADPGEGFGSHLALDINNCRAPLCLKPLDTMVVQSRSGLYSIERLVGAWGSRSIMPPSVGTATSFTEVAVNSTLALATALVQPNANAGCASDPAVAVSAVRVLSRMPGSAHLKHRGFACSEQLRTSPLSGVRSVALSGNGAEFHIGMPDMPASRIGTVSTWTATTSTIKPSDLLVDPDLTSDYHAIVGGVIYLPDFTGDYFGAGLAAASKQLVVGAPFYNGFIPTYGAGYVMIYTR